MLGLDLTFPVVVVAIAALIVAGISADLFRAGSNPKPINDRPRAEDTNIF